MSFSTLARPGVLLRVEGAVLFALSVLLYAYIDGSWLLFALLLFTPDVFMLGYLAGPAIGARCYNLGHIELLPGLLAAYGLLSGNPLLLSIALIWFAHIGMDRAIGYGLKYADAFKHTHLDSI